MAKRSPSFNPNVHGARGLFSFMVFFFHVHNSGLPTWRGPIADAIGFGLLESMKFGVELFFGISGLVILGALRRAPSMVSFAWDRASRIYPVLWATLIVIIAMIIAAGGSAGPGMPPIGLLLANFLAPPPFLDVPLIHPAAWSLGYEFTFYAFAALGWVFAQRGYRLALLITVLVGVAIIVFFPRGLLLPSGVLIGYEIGRAGWIARWARFPIINLILFIALWRFFDWQMGNKIWELNPVQMPLADWVIRLPLILIAWVLGSVALLGIAEGHGPMGRILKSRPLQFLGTISYSFYLWHPVVLAIVKQLFRKLGLVGIAGEASQLAFALIAIGPSLLAAHYSQIFLEIRATMWVRRLGPDGRRATPPVAPTVAS